MPKTIISKEKTFNEPIITNEGGVYHIVSVRRAILSGNDAHDWICYGVPYDIYLYIRQLEGYVKDPKNSKLKEVYDRRFNKADMDDGI